MRVHAIVVPTDCSAVSREALRYADRFASRANATVIAVYGSAFSARLEGEGVAASMVSREDLETLKMPIRTCMQDTIRESLSASTQHEIVIDDCPPADAITVAAKKYDAELIVMGTHDRNRLARAVLGSVTDAVLHGSRRPVLIIREHSSVVERPIRHIFCPFRQGRPASNNAVREAKEIAELLDAKLTLHEVTDTHDIAKKVLGEAERLDADLIVIGTQHRRFSDPSEIGRPAAQIVREAYCPVLSVCA